MFSYDLTTETGKLRRLINDTNEDGHIYEDEDLQFFLSFFENEYNQNVKLLKTAILIVTNLAQKFAESVGTRIKIHRIEKEVTGDSAKAYKELLDSLKGILKDLETSTVTPLIFGGGIFKSDKADYENSNLVPPIFPDKQFDFPDNNPLG